MKENKTKRALQHGEFVLGTVNRYFRSPEIAQVLATAGYDFIWIDMEHSCFGLETVADTARAALAAGITPIVRIPELQSHFISRALDSGALGVIVPEVDSRKQVEDTVRFSKYAPLGRRRTVGRLAHADYAGVNAAEFNRRSNEEVLTSVLVESEAGVENIEEIVSVEGLDLVIIGAGDLSLSLGVPGETDHEKVRKYIREVIEACKRHRVFIGLGGTSGFDVPRRWMGEGVQFYCHSVDIALLMDGAAADARQLRGAVS